MPSGSMVDQPLSEQTFFILLCLASGPRHGYGILKDVQELSNGRIEISVSTLYTSLKRLLEQGWIERVERTEAGEGGHPRKEYRLTQTGQRILNAENSRLQELVRVANQRLPRGTL